MKVSGSYAAIAALSASANAMHLVRSEPTAPVALADDGVSPRPTEAPNYDLFRRADSGTMLYAPDNTCGYISGRPGAGYTCFGSATCAFSVASGEGHVACCADGECNMRYSCVDFSAYFSQSKCDDGCEVDALTLKCTETSAPYCNTISFSGGITDYWCNNLIKSTMQVANTTYAGGEDRVYTTLDATSSSATLITSGSVSERPTVTVSAKASSTSSSAEESSSAASGGGGSKTPVGPIVGGVVGGIAGLALIGAAIFFFLRSKKKKTAAAAAATTTPPTYQAPPMQQQPGTGPNGYNPVPQGQAGFYDPKNPYSTPTQQYNQPAVGGAFYPVQNQAGTPDYNQTNPSSPGTFVSDPRMSQVGSNTSPSPSYNQQNMGGQQGFQPGFQPQQTVIHEAPTNAVGSNGRDETHELA